MGIEDKETRRSVARGHPARTDGLLDLNVLPQRHRRPRLRWAAAAPWLSLLGLIILLYPIFQWFTTTNQAFNLVARNLDRQSATQIAMRAPSGTEAALSTQIAQARDQAEALASVAETVNLQQVAWGDTLQFALDQAPAGATVLSVEQEDDNLVLSGDASTYQVPLAYAQRLRDSGRFLAVSVNVISRIPETSPTPAATPTESAGGSTAAAGPFTFRLTLQTTASNVSTPVPEATDAP